MTYLLGVNLPEPATFLQLLFGKGMNRDLVFLQMADYFGFLILFNRHIVNYY